MIVFVTYLVISFYQSVVQVTVNGFVKPCWRALIVGQYGAWIGHHVAGYWQQQVLMEQLLSGATRRQTLNALQHWKDMKMKWKVLLGLRVVHIWQRAVETRVFGFLKVNFWVAYSLCFNSRSTIKLRKLTIINYCISCYRIWFVWHKIWAGYLSCCKGNWCWCTNISTIVIQLCLCIGYTVNWFSRWIMLTQRNVDFFRCWYFSTAVNIYCSCFSPFFS